MIDTQVCLWNGWNNDEVEEFIGGCRNFFNNIGKEIDLEINHGEGEIEYNGSYFKAPCYIMYRISTGVYVIPERMIDIIINMKESL